MTRTDASNHSVTAVLEQQTDGRWYPLEFWSRKLMLTTMNYLMFDCELLNVYLTVCHLHHILTGWTFSVLLDHQPLSEALLQ